MRVSFVYVVLSIVLFILFWFIYFFFSSKDIFVVCPRDNIYIVDGDTLYIGNIKIRILGIDAMELKNQKSWVVKKIDTKNESCLKYYGFLAKNFLINVTKQQCIKVEIKGKDKYGRYLARVYNCTVDLSECTDLGRYMVLYGLAISFDNTYYIEESIARSNNRGVWKCSMSKNV